MSIDGEMCKEGVIHIYNGKLFIHKKRNNAICSDMDGPGDCHTEWSKLEKNIWYPLYVKSKKMIKMTYLRNRNRLRYKNQTYGYKEGKMGGCKLGDRDWHIHTTIYKMDN